MLLSFIFFGFSIVSSFAGLLLLFLFQTRAEARKFSIYSFWVAQNHEKFPFGVSVMCRSMKKFHLVFLSCAEARKSFIWCFWNVQKHEKSPFALSETFRSIKKQNKLIMLLIYYYCCPLKCVTLPAKKDSSSGWHD